jgi:hypothetical protein
VEYVDRRKVHLHLLSIKLRHFYGLRLKPVQPVAFLIDDAEQLTSTLWRDVFAG